MILLGHHYMIDVAEKPNSKDVYDIASRGVLSETAVSYFRACLQGERVTLVLGLP